jgi:uncharacterized membrane protein/1-acyl-sn-glycerol-3-phosphate acyltransferase
MNLRERFLSRHLIAALIVGHIAALSFGLAGLLIAVPHPHLWADSEMGVRVYSFGMQYAGGLHILFATAAMLLVGIKFLGLRRTLWFFAITCVVSLSAELIGTTTGFPFGDYRYTSGLGYKILSEVPFTIPLSWFYVGLAAYLLAIVLVGTGPGWKRTLGAVFTGALLLTIWDLVLDPAMAHQDLDVRFWVWEQSGIYFDMPAKNFLGWILTGFVFIGISRLVWGSDPPVARGLIRVSYIIYLANLIFAMVISAAVGLWWPVWITVVIGVLPATIALIASEGWSDERTSETALREDDTAQRVSRGVMTMCARLFLARDTSRVHVDGLENVPDRGPALLISRHYHHLLDGCVLQTRIQRPTHIVVAVDWARQGWQRRLLELACSMARWPTVVRPDAPGTESFSDEQRVHILRQGLTDAVRLLAEGRVLTVFPEGYPDIDPHGSRKDHQGEQLPFDPGFISIARAAERRSGLQIPLIPVGFSYVQTGNGRWEAAMRIGAPIYLATYLSSEALVDDVSSRVRKLSEPALAPVTNESKTLTEIS